jgi:hypothetical protein
MKKNVENKNKIVIKIDKFNEQVNKQQNNKYK